MKSVFIALIVLVFSLDVAAKDEKYAVSEIPEELKKNVDAVVRDDEMVFTITSKRSAKCYVHFVVTILNSNAKHYAENVIGYEKKERVIKDLRAAVYGANGNVIKKLKNADILDRSAYSEGTLFSDNRIKYFDLTQTTYPYTVEVEYEMDYNYLYAIPGSTVTASEKVSVQNFKYQLAYPPALKPAYKTYNITTKPVVTNASGNEIMTWTLNNMPAHKIEPFSPRSAYIMEIEAAPGNFEYSGYAGNMASWKDLGVWYSSLNEGRDKLPESTKAKVKELTKDLNTKEEKAKVLYEYLQSKTRYVSVQLGIGGFQPFEAITVDQTGYGDCKALSNYMVAMLKEVGVKSYYTLIYGGEDSPPVDVSFPSHQANHVIVAVPNEKDTLWLECTSQTNPFAYVGNFTGNRYGLMVTEEGGKLVKTTYYPTDVNVQQTTANVTLDANGNAKAKVTTSYSGLQYENGDLNFIVNYSPEEQKKWIQRNTSIPSFDVGPFTITNKKTRIPTAIVQMDLVMNKYASVSNKRIFMTPNLMNRLTSIPEKVENRKTPFVIKLGYTDIDTIRYIIPESIYPEFLPPTSKITSRFGTYESGFKLDQGSLVYFRKMVRKDGEYPAEAYQELVDFYKNVNKADNTKLVFLTKT